MQQIFLRRYWWPGIVVTGFFGLIGLLMLWDVTSMAILAWQAGEPLPEDWTWPRVIIFDLVFGGLVFYICWLPWADLLTVFTDEGIKKPRLFRSPLFLRWGDVRRVADAGWVIKLEAADQCIRINSVVFKEPEKLIAEIEARVPKHALPPS